jgi:uncharacterized protein YqgC (DUF456 family)
VDPASVLLWLLGVALCVAGLVGCVVSPLPGPPLILAGLICAAWAEDFRRVGWPTLLLIGVLAALAVAIDLLAGVLGARRFRASKLALLGAALGGLVGIAVGLPGVLLGPFVGAALGEWISRRDLRQAGKVGLGTWLGLVAGALVKLALAVAMLCLFAFSYAL